MLSLSISAKPCLPGRKFKGAEQAPRPTSCEVCGAPGGANGELLERHITTGGRYKHVCPLCHHCLHIDFAGIKRSGRIIWLPEMSQETLNLLCLAMFMAVKNIAPPEDKAPADAGDVTESEEDADKRAHRQASIELLNHSKNLYGAFRKRAEHVEMALGSNVAGMDRLGLKGKLSEPQHIASLIAYAAKTKSLTERQVAERVEGLRFLPNPIFFDAYTQAAYATLAPEEAAEMWMGMVRAYHAEEGQKLKTMGTESFEAPGQDAPNDGEMAPEPDHELIDLPIESIQAGEYEPEPR